MSVLMSKDRKEIIVTCSCGCMEAFHVKIYDDDDMDLHGILSFMKAASDTEYAGNPWRAFKVKMCKLWTILRGKDYCYSDIVMTSNDYAQFKDYINRF